MQSIFRIQVVTRFGWSTGLLIICMLVGCMTQKINKPKDQRIVSNIPTDHRKTGVEGQRHVDKLLFGGKLVVLRSLGEAKKIPAFLGPEVKRISRAKTHTCQNGRQAISVVITTYMGGETWKKYPLALDVWECGEGEYEYPVKLTRKKAKELLDHGIAAAQKRQLDFAEFCFRRYVNAFPKDWQGHQNLGYLYIDRETELDTHDANHPELKPIVRNIVFHMGRALENHTPDSVALQFDLSRVLMRAGKLEETKTVLDAVTANESMSQLQKMELENLILEWTAHMKKR